MAGDSGETSSSKPADKGKGKAVEDPKKEKPLANGKKEDDKIIDCAQQLLSRWPLQQWPRQQWPRQQWLKQRWPRQRWLSWREQRHAGRFDPDRRGGTWYARARIGV